MRYVPTTSPESVALSKALKQQGFVFVGPTTFSVPHGFYSAPFQVDILNATPGVQIYYTLNGTAPFTRNPTTGVVTPTGTLYTGPLNVSSTTTLRAAGLFTGQEPSEIETATYLFLADVVTQQPTGTAPGTFVLEPQSARVPGTLAAWCEMLTRFGTLDLATVMAPAIRHAERGFRVTNYLSECIAESAADLARFPDSARLYLPGGAPLQHGDLLVQAEYAATLRTIAADGPAALYGTFLMILAGTRLPRERQGRAGHEARARRLLPTSEVRHSEVYWSAARQEPAITFAFPIGDPRRGFGAAEVDDLLGEGQVPAKSDFEIVVVVFQQGDAFAVMKRPKAVQRPPWWRFW